MPNEMYIGAINLSPYFSGYHPNQIVFMGVPFDIADSLILFTTSSGVMNYSEDKRCIYFRFTSYFKSFKGIIAPQTKYEMKLVPAYMTEIRITCYDIREHRHRFILELHHG